MYMYIFIVLKQLFNSCYAVRYIFDHGFSRLPKGSYVDLCRSPAWQTGALYISNHKLNWLISFKFRLVYSISDYTVLEDFLSSSLARFFSLHIDMIFSNR